jgi:rhamnosyltransferase
MKVNILMATYNGERFISEQIESIRNQSFQAWELYIRDDRSSDQTPEIIREYTEKDSRIHFINDGETLNLGVIGSFHTLLNYAEADYYFFSDQDDVWLPNKLELALNRAQEEPKGTPLMVYTDLKVVNQNLEVISESMIRTQSGHANTELVQELTENTVTGGVSMINHSLATQWYDDENVIMHDWYLALLASATGKLIYIDEPTQLYRQHDANVLGARTLSKRMKRWFKPLTLVQTYWQLIIRSQKQAEKLLRLEKLSEPNRQMVQDVVSLLGQPISVRHQLIKKYDFGKNKAFHTFVFRTLVLTKFGYKGALK